MQSIGRVIFSVFVALWLCFTAHLSLANTIDTAKPLSLGTPITDALSSTEDTIYYRVLLSEPGCLQLNFQHLSTGSTASYWRTTVQSSDGQKSYLYTDIAGNVTDTAKNVGLPSGTYLVKVARGSYLDNRNYTLTVSATAGDYEQEQNDAIDGANPVTLGTPYKGFIAKLPSGSDVDYYRFTINQPSYVKVNFKHGSNGSTSNFWRTTVQSADGFQSYLHTYIDGNTTDSTKYVGLPAGTYLVKVAQGSLSDDREYTLTVSATPGNVEQEQNNTVDDATPVTLGTSYQGNIGILPTGLDVDYFSFTINQPSQVQLNFKHLSTGNNNSYWATTVQSADGTESYLYTAQSGTVTDSTKYVGLPAGTYLVKVTQGTSSDQRDYTLTVSATAGIYEQEPNSTVDGANPVTLGTPYQGNIGALQSGSDVDYYRFTIDQPSYVKVNFKHGSNGSTAIYWRTTVQSVNGLQSYLHTDIGGNTTDSTKYVGLPAGTYLVKVGAGNSSDDRDYTLTVSATAGVYEQEPNSTVDGANPVILGTPYQGNIGTLQTGSDVDYYSFTITERSYVKLNFKHLSNGNASIFWRATIQSIDGLESYLYTGIAGTATDINKYVGLPAGTYLVKVTGSSDDRDYTITVSATPGNVELEQNNTVDTATPIALGTEYRGNVGGMTTGLDADYYRFTITQPSYVQLNFKHVSNGYGYSYWRSTVLSSDGMNSHLYIDIAGNVTDTTKYVGLPAGTYLVKVNQGAYSDDRDYTLTVSATAGNYEQEQNDTVELANPIILGTAYQGNVEKLPSTSDVDYYSFTITEPGYVKLYFTHVSNGSSGIFWRTSIESADGLKSYLYTNIDGNTTDTTKYVGLPAGSYLVKVTGTSDDRDYTLTMTALPGNYEQERNDTVDSATTVAIGTPYTGNIGTLPTGSDLDFYKFTTRERGVIRLSFKHDSNGYGSNNWQVSLSSGDGQITYYTTFVSGVLTELIKDLELPAGSFLVKVAQGTVRDDRSYIVTVIDPTPPTLSPLSIPRYSNDLTIAISDWSAADNVGVTGYLITEWASPPASDAGWSTTPPASFSFATAGDKALFAWVRDAAGNVSEPQQAVVTVDQAPPVVDAFTVSGRTSQTVAIGKLLASDNLGVTGYFISESPQPPAASAEGWRATAPTSYTLSQASVPTLYAFARDEVGNVSAPVSAPLSPTFFNLTAATAGTGDGTINSDPTGLACAGDSSLRCSANFSGSVSLFATPARGSSFDGWSGACSGKGTCTIVMDADKTVGATFTLAPLAMIGSTPYPSLQQAYDSASDGSVIMMREGSGTSSLTANRRINLIIRGGYLAGFGAIASDTLLSGKFSLRSGTVKVQGITLR